jgi:hypothetical protein
VWTPYAFMTPIRAYFRKRRFAGFRDRVRNCRTVIDVGGDHSIWSVIGRKEGVTVVNIAAPAERDGFPYLIADGCNLPFDSHSVDLAFSNSAIEHVGSFENQQRFAAELLRVGKSVYCQTPCRRFPIDPHLAAFFLHWLPKSFLTPAFLRYFTFHGWLLGHPYEYDVTWLSKKQLRQIFPGCSIRTERFLGLPKSFIITKQLDMSPSR